VARDFKNLTAGAAALGPDKALYLADATDIVRVKADGKRSVVAGGFVAPFGIAVDARGTVFVADTGTHSVYRIEKRGKKTRLAGSGKVGRKDARGEKAEFSHPTGIVVDARGNLYIKESGRQENSPWMHIRKLAPDGHVSTLARIRRSAG
jgi:sugar lactone lactonase YvrE